MSRGAALQLPRSSVYKAEAFTANGGVLMKGMFLAVCGGLLGMMLIPTIGAISAYQSGVWVAGLGNLTAGTGSAAYQGGLYALTAFFPINLFLALVGGSIGLVLGSPLLRARSRRSPVSA